MANRIEEATVTCAECGLAGKLIRDPARGTMLAFADYADFRQLCRKVTPRFVEECPWWIAAQQVAILELKLPTEH